MSRPFVSPRVAIIPWAWLQNSHGFGGEREREKPVGLCVCTREFDFFRERCEKNKKET